MDAVHTPELYPWIGEKIVIKEYFDKFREVVNETRSATTKAKGDLALLDHYDVKSLVETVQEIKDESIDRSIQHDDEIDDAVYEEIKSLCDINNLTTPYELSPMQAFMDPGPMTDSERQNGSNKYQKYHATRIPEVGKQNLRCLALQAKFLENARSYDKHKRARISRHPNDNWLEAMPVKPKKISHKVNEKEILLAIRIYRPVKKEAERYAINLANMRYVQELYMLGSNMLSELRDHIKCNADNMIAGDMSDNPPWKERSERIKRWRGIGFDDSQTFGAKVSNPLPRKMTAKEAYPSGFLYIEDCFYNDMRWPNCKDYSEVIRKWADNPNRNIGPFTTAKMEDTKMEDLTIRLGYPYVYVHQGNHEHLFTFTDARLVSVDDEQRPSRYPFERSVGNQHSKFCMICNVNIATFITTNNERVPEEPFFFCDECFRSFNYDEMGEKIGSFQAYPYVDINAL